MIIQQIILGLLITISILTNKYVVVAPNLVLMDRSLWTASESIKKYNQSTGVSPTCNNHRDLSFDSRITLDTQVPQWRKNVLDSMYPRKIISTVTFSALLQWLSLSDSSSKSSGMSHSNIPAHTKVWPSS